MHAGTDLTVFSYEQQEKVLHNRSLKPFSPKWSHEKEPWGSWKGFLFFFFHFFVFSSRRGSMRALSISHLCISETQVNKQNIRYQTHTWVLCTREQTALSMYLHNSPLCNTCAQCCQCFRAEGFPSQGFSACWPNVLSRKWLTGLAEASGPHIGLLQLRGQLLFLRSYWRVKCLWVWFWLCVCVNICVWGLSSSSQQQRKEAGSFNMWWPY